MKTFKVIGLMVSLGAAIAMSTASSADAHGRKAGAAEGVDVTKVRLVRGGEAAKVWFRVACQAGQRFSLAVEVIQDAERNDPGFDAYYTAVKLANGTCTGRVERFSVLTRPEQSGRFSSPDSRLSRGPAEVAVGGDFDGIPDVTFHQELVK